MLSTLTLLSLTEQSMPLTGLWVDNRSDRAAEASPSEKETASTISLLSLNIAAFTRLFPQSMQILKDIQIWFWNYDTAKIIKFDLKQRILKIIFLKVQVT